MVDKVIHSLSQLHPYILPKSKVQRKDCLVKCLGFLKWRCFIQKISIVVRWSSVVAISDIVESNIPSQESNSYKNKLFILNNEFIYCIALHLNKFCFVYLMVKQILVISL